MNSKVGSIVLVPVPVAVGPWEMIGGWVCYASEFYAYQ